MLVDTSDVFRLSDGAEDLAHRLAAAVDREMNRTAATADIAKQVNQLFPSMGNRFTVKPGLIVEQ